MVRKIIWYWLPAFFWLGGIYFLSSQQGLRVSTVNWQDFILRKIAHFIEYFISTFLFFRAFHYGSGISRQKSIVFAFFISLIYAATDEFHQTFVPAREGRLRDILIDSTGNLFAALLLKLKKLNRFERLFSSQ